MNRTRGNPMLELTGDETEASDMACLLTKGRITLRDLNRENGKGMTASMGQLVGTPEDASQCNLRMGLTACINVRCQYLMAKPK